MWWLKLASLVGMVISMLAEIELGLGAIKNGAIPRSVRLTKITEKKNYKNSFVQEWNANNFISQFECVPFLPTEK